MTTRNEDFKWACEQVFAFAGGSSGSWIRPKDVIEGALELLAAMDEFNKSKTATHDMSAGAYNNRVHGAILGGRP